MAIKIGQYMNMTGTPRPGSQPVPVNPPPTTPDQVKEEIQKAPTLSKPATLELQTAPLLSQPGTLEFQPPPALSTPNDPQTQPAPELSVPMAVQSEVSQQAPAITLRQPVPFQEAPPLTTPQPVPFQPPPELSDPAPIAPFEPAPPLTVRSDVPFQRPPELSTPAVIPLQSAPPLSAPTPVPFEPAPPLTVPSDVPFQPAPPLPTPSVIAFQPAPPQQLPAVIPFQEAPVNPPIHDPTETDINKSFSDGLLDVHPPLQDMPAIDTTLFEGTVDKTTVTPAPGITPSVPAASQPSEVPEKVHAPTYTEERPYSDGLLDVHPGRQQMALGRQDKWSDKVNTSGGNLDLISSNVPAPFIGSFGFASLNPATLPNNLKLAAITEAQILAARIGAQKVIDNAKNIATIATKQQSTLIAMGIDVANDAIFGNMRGETYHPVDNSKDFTPHPKWSRLPDFNRYYPSTRHNTPDDLDHAAQNTIPEPMSLPYLNNPDTADPETKQRRLAAIWTQPTFTLRQIPNPYVVMVNPNSDELVKAFKSQQVEIKASTSAKETRGFFDVNAANDTSRENSLPTDDDSYMPLVFTDLRPLQGKHYRSVYFRPFIKSLSEELSPQWNMANYFGRVDPVATYQNTNRTINLAFKVVAFAPEDLLTMYQKLGWLNSMVYPQFRNSMYFAGPVIRMRVGDIINAVGKEGNRGVPGVITSLNYNYDQSTWELLNGRRVPREVDVSLGFHVLHEYPIGLYHNLGQDESDLSFGGIRAGGDETNSEATSYINVDRFRAIFGKDYLNDQRLQSDNTIDPTTGDVGIEGTP